jgi:predicted transcriptional regulator of viral defense system
MNKNITTSPQQKRHAEDTKFESQYKRVSRALFRQMQTMLMAQEATGVRRANICRIIARLRRENKLYLVRKGVCTVSKARAGYYTTNAALWLKAKEVAQ